MSEENEKQPTYTFWAEEVKPTQYEQSSTSESSPSNMYQSMDSTMYNYNQPYPPKPDIIPPLPEMFSVPPKKQSKVKKSMTFLGKAAVFGLIAGLTFYGSNLLISKLTGNDKNGLWSVTNQGSGNHNLNLDPLSSDEIIPSTSTSNNVNIQSSDISEVVEKTMPATVAITSTYDSSYDVWGYQIEGSDARGSGIIIGQKDNELYIASNNHVIEGASEIMVTFIDGSEAKAEIRGRNSSADLAVITVDTKTMSSEALSSIKVAKLGSSENVKVGQMAIAIGNALGYGQSVTVGYISAKDREIATDANTNLTVLQTDAAINPGNSGGALINIEGEVIGINSAKFSDTNVEGMGYSIPISIAYPIVDELMNREILTEEEMGYLGVYPQDVDSTVASMYEWPIGVYVAKLVEGGAADKAGIYVGDIITEVNNITLSSSDALRETVNSYRYGTTVTINLMRFIDGEYKELTFDVVLQKNTEK